MSEKRQRQLRTIECHQCGLAFRRKRISQRFCSPRCGAIARPKSSRSGGGRKGQSAWNKGLKNCRPNYSHSPQTKEAIRCGHLTNGRPRKSAVSYLERRSARYAQWRKSVFERDNYRCQDCGARSSCGNRVEIQAHHLKEFSVHPELRYHVENGITLCRPCHIKTPSFGKKKPGGKAGLVR